MRYEISMNTLSLSNPFKVDQWFMSDPWTFMIFEWKSACLIPCDKLLPVVPNHRFVSSSNFVKKNCNKTHFKWTLDCWREVICVGSEDVIALTIKYNILQNLTPRISINILWGSSEMSNFTKFQVVTSQRMVLYKKLFGSECIKFVYGFWWPIV
jgi:hypothetical protein